MSMKQVSHCHTVIIISHLTKSAEPKYLSTVTLYNTGCCRYIVKLGGGGELVPFTLRLGSNITQKHG